jgi:hypothetical protein
MAAIIRGLEPDKEEVIDLPAIEAAAGDGLKVTMPVPPGHCPVIDLKVDGVADGADSQVVWGSGKIVGAYGIPGQMTGAGAISMCFASNAASGAATQAFTSGGAGTKGYVSQAVARTHGKIGFRGKALQITVTANDGADSWTSGTVRIRYSTTPMTGNASF